MRASEIMEMSFGLSIPSSRIALIASRRSALGVRVHSQEAGVQGEGWGVQGL